MTIFFKPSVFAAFFVPGDLELIKILFNIGMERGGGQKKLEKVRTWFMDDSGIFVLISHKDRLKFRSICFCHHLQNGLS